MNKITFDHKTFDGEILSKDKIENWYINNFASEIRRNLELLQGANNIETKVIDYLKKHLCDILIASPTELAHIASIVDRFAKGIFRENNGHRAKTTFGEVILTAFNYNNYRKNKLIQLAKRINVKTCPYCNMSYTLCAEEQTGNNQSNSLAKFQFDHFFDKLDYPMLSMSLYNLIPSCAVCNNGKSVNQLSLDFHPYHSDIHKQFRFVISNPIELYSGKTTDYISIDLKPESLTNKSDLDKFINTFHLKALYSRHRDIAQEIFCKAYEESYYTDEHNFQFLNLTETERKRLWMGTYVNESEIHKRPLTKFIQDLWEQATMYKSIGGSDIIPEALFNLT